MSDRNVSLSELLRVKSIFKEEEIRPRYASKGRLVKHTRVPIKTSQSVPKTQPKQAMKNVASKSKSPVKKSSTLNLLDKLKSLDVKREGATFLEEANEEIEIAFKQLRELQAMIKKKSEDELDEELEERKKKVVASYNKQFERMQNKYLNKTKIHYKSLQEFENLTEERKESELSLPKKKVNVVYNRIKPKKSKTKIDKEEEDVKKSESMHKPRFRSVRTVQAYCDKLEDKIKSLLSDMPDDLHFNKNVKAKKIEYLLRPEHMIDFPIEVKRDENLSDLDRTRMLLATTSKQENIEEQKPRKKTRVRFKDTKLDQSVLKSDWIPSSSEEEMISPDLRDENLMTKGKDFELPMKSTRKPATRDVSSEPTFFDEKLARKFDNPALAKSVLKSSYLSKEFSSESKALQPSTERNVQLLETILSKFGKPQLANSEERDQKMYLNNALKDTCYTEIEE